MKIACLQMDPKLGKVEQNIQQADKILEEALGHVDIDKQIDILVLPEMVFTGYNFETKSEIRPFLEPTTAGISTQWAQKTAKRLKCYTIVGYPELTNDYNPPAAVRTKAAVHYDPFSETEIERDSDEDTEDDEIQKHSFNSCVIVGPDGEVVMNYQKSFLYETDETWASEGPEFGTLTLSIPSKTDPTDQPRSVTTAIGICMDLNPYRFQAPFKEYEFANHVLKTNAQLAIVPMAWLGSKQDIDPSIIPQLARVRDDRLISYWTMRMEPLFGENDTPDSDDEEELDAELDDDDDGGVRIVTPDATDDDEDEGWIGVQGSGNTSVARGGKVVFVTCNRVGKEKQTLFGGSSLVMSIEKGDGMKIGNVKKLEALGMAEERLLISDVDL